MHELPKRFARITMDLFSTLTSFVLFWMGASIWMHQTVDIIFFWSFYKIVKILIKTGLLMAYHVFLRTNNNGIKESGTPRWKYFPALLLVMERLLTIEQPSARCINLLCPNTGHCPRIWWKFYHSPYRTCRKSKSSIQGARNSIAYSCNRDEVPNSPVALAVHVLVCRCVNRT